MEHPRIAREKKTVEAMIKLFCQAKHKPNVGLCSQCKELLRYSKKRLAKCPYGDNKPTCRKCPIHCYDKNMRSRVQAVMKYAGPRMLVKSPWLGLAHVLDSMKRTENK